MAVGVSVGVEEGLLVGEEVGTSVGVGLEEGVAEAVAIGVGVGFGVTGFIGPAGEAWVLTPATCPGTVSGTLLGPPTVLNWGA